jgi:hypothetical protein
VPDPDHHLMRQAITLGGLYAVLKNADYEPRIVNNGAADTLIIIDNGARYRLVIAPDVPPPDPSSVRATYGRD